MELFQKPSLKKLKISFLNDPIEYRKTRSRLEDRDGK